MFNKGIFITLISLSVSLFGCEEKTNNNTDPTIEVTSVEVTPSDATLTTIGETVALQATVMPENATDKSVVWTSSNAAVATVDATSGVVTAVSEGAANITATAGGQSDKATITVKIESTPEPEPEPEPESAKVYAVGFDVNPQGKRLATLWVDGEAQSLSTVSGSYARGLWVDEKDNVYASGWDVVGQAFLPALWVNGERQLLETSGYGETYSVFVYGSDVYVAGLYDAGGSGLEVRAAYWKNGVRQEITTTDGYATAVYADDSGVYVAYWRQNREGVYQACLWHNDTETVLSTAASETYAVTVHNGDVYVAGREHAGDINWWAAVWKNGTREFLSDEFSYGRSIFIDNEDIYIAGLNGNGSFDSAAKAGYWKNSEFIPLTDGSASADANAVSVCDGKVYVGGYKTPDLNSYDIHRATVWTDGVATQLSNNQSEVLGLFVKK
jgi:hypothetical protein